MEEIKNTLIALLIALILVASGCAHHGASDAPPHQVSAQHLVRAHVMPSWSGVIRISTGNSSRELENSPEVVVGTVQGLVNGLGLDARVQCLEHEGDLGVRGALHARVRIDFPTRLSLAQKYEVLHLLESMRPSENAYLLPGTRSPAPTATMAAVDGEPAAKPATDSDR